MKIYGTKFTDGTRTVEIALTTYRNCEGYTSPDFSADFFEVGGLPYNEDEDAHIVENVQYLIDYAIDWRDSKGDFFGQDEDIGGQRVVIVDGDWLED